MTQDRVIEKLRKIKAQAESAGTTEAEAQAFAAALQRMLLDHKLALTDLEFETMTKEEPVEQHEIDYTKYPDLKLRRTRVAWIEVLAAIIAKAHACRILVYPGTSAIGLVGRATDVAVAEFMLVTLQRAAERLATAAQGQYAWETYKRDGHCRRARGFKHGWLMGFIGRLQERYDREQVESVAAHGGSTALVRIKTTEEDLDVFLSSFKDAPPPRLGRVTSVEGLRRGRASADAIALRANALEEGAETPKLPAPGSR